MLAFMLLLLMPLPLYPPVESRTHLAKLENLHPAEITTRGDAIEIVVAYEPWRRYIARGQRDGSMYRVTWYDPSGVVHGHGVYWFADAALYGRWQSVDPKVGPVADNYRILRLGD